MGRKSQTKGVLGGSMQGTFACCLCFLLIIHLSNDN